MKKFYKDIENNFFLLKVIFKEGKAEFTVAFFEIILSILSYYVATKIGVWIYDSVEVRTLTECCLIVVGIYGSWHLLMIIQNWLYGYLQPRASLKVNQKLMSCLASKVFEIRQRELDSAEFYDKYYRAISEVKGRQNEVIEVWKNIVGSFFEIILFSVLSVKISILFLFVFVVTSLLKAIIVVVVNEQEYRRYEESSKISRRLDYVNRVIYQQEYSRFLRNNLGVKSILQNRIDENTEEFNKVIEKYRFRLFGLRTLDDFITTVFINVFPWIISVYGLFSHKYSVGEVMVIMGITAFLPQVCIKFFGSFASIRKQSLYISNLREILDYSAKQRKKEVEIENLNQDTVLELENVSFAYLNETKRVIRNVNLKIRKNEKIAFVGPNGAGKSTLINILSGLYSPTEGRAYLYGNDLDKVTMKSINEHIIVIDQNTLTLSFSIIENILQRPAICDEDYRIAEDAIKKVGLYDKIMGLKNGLDSMISKEFDSEGVSFSGGEFQKLAIARVYASDAQIIILDEPTSALDAISEQEIIELLFEVVSNRTMIIVSHRLSFIRYVDTVCYINEGMICESGSHEELMQNRKEYFELFSTQADRYSIGDVAK